MSDFGEKLPMDAAKEHVQRLAIQLAGELRCAKNEAPTSEGKGFKDLSTKRQDQIKSLNIQLNDFIKLYSEEEQKQLAALRTAKVEEYQEMEYQYLHKY